MRTLSGKDVCLILEKHGYVQVRQRGSHIIMQKQAKDSSTTIPVPNHKELRIGTLRSIIRQSGIEKTVFE